MVVHDFICMRSVGLLRARNKRKIHKQIRRIAVPRFGGLIVWGAVIMVLYQ